MSSIFGPDNEDLSADDLIPRKTQIMAGMLRPRTTPAEPQTETSDDDVDITPG